MVSLTRDIEEESDFSRVLKSRENANEKVQ